MLLRPAGLAALIVASSACSSPSTTDVAAAGHCIRFEPYPGYTTCLNDRPLAPDDAEPAVATAIAAAARPEQVDHRTYLRGCLAVHDQGFSNWCSANVATAAVEAAQCRDGDPVSVSVAHHSYVAFGQVEFTGEIVGAAQELIEAMDRMAANQLVDSRVWRDDCSSEDRADCARAMNASRPDDRILVCEGEHRADVVRTIAGRDPEIVKQAIADGFDVAVDLPLYRGVGWQTDSAAESGTIQLPDQVGPAGCLCECSPDAPGCESCPDEPHCSLGQHSILLVGYDDGAGTFVFLNSFGVEFGDDGYGTMPQEYVARFASRRGAHIEAAAPHELPADCEDLPDDEPVVCYQRTNAGGGDFCECGRYGCTELTMEGFDGCYCRVLNELEDDGSLPDTTCQGEVCCLQLGTSGAYDCLCGEICDPAAGDVMVDSCDADHIVGTYFVPGTVIVETDDVRVDAVESCPR